MLPREIEQARMPTLVIRQRGEAWTHPFTAVFEPSAEAAPQVLGVEQLGDGRALALRVRTAGHGRQTIMSGDDDDALFERDGMRLHGRYAIVSERADGPDYLFLGSGRELAALGYALSAQAGKASAALWREHRQWLYTASRPLRLQVPAADWPASLAFTVDGRPVRIAGRPGRVRGQRVLTFEMPAMAATALR
jgi:hypothetical protein